MSHTDIHSGSWAKSIFKVGKWYVLASLLVKGINAFTLPIFTHYMSPSEMGIYNSINSLKAFIPLIISLGLDGAFIRFFHEYKKDHQKLASMFSSTFWFVLFFGSVACVLLFFGFKHYHQDYNPLSIALAVFPPIFFQLGMLGIAFFNQSLESYKTTLFQISSTLIGVGFSIYFVVSLNSGVQGRLIGDSIIALILMLMVVVYFVRNNILQFKFDKAYIKTALLFSLPLLPVSLSAWVNTQSSLLLIQKYFPGQSVAGLFGLATSVALLMYYAIDAITQVLNPVVMSGLINDRLRTHQKIRELMLMFTVVILFIHLLIVYFSKELVIVFTANAQAYKSAYLFIAPLCITYMFGIYHRLFNTVISFHKKNIYITYAVIAGAICMFMCNIVLLPLYGPKIAIVSQIIGTLIMVGLEFYFARKLEHIKFGLIRYWPFLLIYFLGVALFYGYLNVDTHFIQTLVLKIGIVTVVGLLFIYFGNYIQPLKEFLKRKLKLN